MNMKWAENVAWKEEKSLWRSGMEIWRKEPAWKTLAYMEYNIELSFKFAYEDVNWIYLCQDRSQWRALVNTLISILVS